MRGDRLDYPCLQKNACIGAGEFHFFHSSKTLNSSVLDLSKKVEKTMKLNEFDKRGVFSFPE